MHTRHQNVVPDPAPESFSNHFFDSCNSLQQRRASIEAHAQHQLQGKQRELDRESAEYRALLSRAKGLKHQLPLDHRGR
jgi:hypothetical protein